jgi:hypothetical protein
MSLLYKRVLEDNHLPRLYKVLMPDKYPCHGLLDIYPRPSSNAPGDWVHIVGDEVSYSVGFQLYSRGFVGSWRRPGCQIFRVEARGVTLFRYSPLDRPFCHMRPVGKCTLFIAKEARLLWEVPEKEFSYD